ncbi:MAG TPA: FlgD immunoglobulin-like domain containing protein, partial [Candidatus Eisenbacteria bacterium]
EDQYLEDLGLATALGLGGANAEGTRYDRFDNQTPSSAQLSFGRPLRSKYGCSQTQVFAYQAIAWHSGTLTSGVLTTQDAAILNPWLTLSIGAPRRFWGSGEGIMQSMQNEGGLARSFLNNTLGVLQSCTGIRLAGCGGAAIDTTYCLPTSPVVGAHFASSVLSRARGNGCPNLHAFDVLATNPAVTSARGQWNYFRSGGPVSYASVTNVSTGPSAYRSVLDGISVGRLRTNPGYYFNGCDDVGASLLRTSDVLNWFGAATLCKASAALSEVPEVGQPPAAPPAVAVLGNARPNPMVRHTIISMTQGASATPVRLDIFDVTGRLVRCLVDGPLAAGPHEFAWDGRSAEGHPVAGGLYFYRMSAGDRVESRKLLVVD